jgi:hypothetical protein
MHISVPFLLAVRVLLRPTKLPDARAVLTGILHDTTQLHSSPPSSRTLHSRVRECPFEHRTLLCAGGDLKEQEFRCRTQAMRMKSKRPLVP